MTNTQTARFKAYSLALAHLKENAAITAGVPAVTTVSELAQKLVDAIKEADQVRVEKRDARAAGKNQFREKFADQALIIAKAVAGFAAGINDQELLASMKFSRSDLTYGTDRELGSMAANILATARKLEKELVPFGITGETITRFASDVKAYLDKTNQTRNRTAERKGAGQQIQLLLTQLRNVFDQQLDGLLLQFRDSHPAFYTDYMNKRTVINPASRKTRVEGFVTDRNSRLPLGNVQVALKDSKIVTSTLADGSYYLKTPALTAATVEFSLEGYKPLTVVVDVKLGQGLNQSVELVRA